MILLSFNWTIKAEEEQRLYWSMAEHTRTNPRAHTHTPVQIKTHTLIHIRACMIRHRHTHLLSLSLSPLTYSFISGKACVEVKIEEWVGKDRQGRRKDKRR